VLEYIITSHNNIKIAATNSLENKYVTLRFTMVSKIDLSLIISKSTCDYVLVCLKRTTCITENVTKPLISNSKNHHYVVATKRVQQTNYYLNSNIYVRIDYLRRGLFCSWLWYTRNPYRRKCMVCEWDNLLTIGHLLLQWRLCVKRFVNICLWTIWTLGAANSKLRSFWWVFFWSSGIMECTCMLFTFENGVLLMR